MELRSQLRAMKTGKRELEAIVRLNELTTRDRDLLRDALRVVSGSARSSATATMSVF